MMLYGAVLGCASPVLTVAACLSYKSPFVAPKDQVFKFHTMAKGSSLAKQKGTCACMLMRWNCVAEGGC